MLVVRLTVAFAVVALAGVGRSAVRAQELPELTLSNHRDGILDDL